jgi:hypothetical protein
MIRKTGQTAPQERVSRTMAATVANTTLATSEPPTAAVRRRPAAWYWVQAVAAVVAAGIRIKTALQGQEARVV